MLFWSSRNFMPVVNFFIDGRLQNTDLDNHSQMREPLWKSGSPAEKFQHSVGAKNILDWTHWRQRNSFTLPVSLLPKGGTAQCQKRLKSACDLSQGEKWECMIKHQASPAVWGTRDPSREAHFFLLLSRILSCEMHDLELNSCSERTAARAGNGAYLGSYLLLWRRHQRGHPWATGDAFLLIP